VSSVGLSADRPMRMDRPRMWRYFSFLFPDFLSLVG
jgi:hypothetical protein